MGRKRKGRNINGVILVDKYTGESSNFILQQVKRCFGAAKAGHTGALDPLATGMLPICLGEATKFSQFLLDADKTYITTATLGIRTDTSDSDGEVVERKDVDVELQSIEALIETFKGDIKQVPSMFSALKHEGKPLYHYARQGITIDRPARDIHIYKLEILRFEGHELDLLVTCSKGTYIRSLVDDIGQALGCGAHVSMLRRTKVADYPEDRMISMSDLLAQADTLKQAALAKIELPETLDASQESSGDAIPASKLDIDYSSLDALLLPMDTAVLGLSEYLIDEKGLWDFTHGQAINCQNQFKYEQQIRVYTKDNRQFMGMGVIDKQGMIQPKRVVVYSD